MMRSTLYKIDVDEFIKDARNIASTNPKCVIKNLKHPRWGHTHYKFIPSSCEEIRDLLNKYIIANP